MPKPKKSKKKSPGFELLDKSMENAKKRWKTDPGISLFDKVSTAREVMKQAGLSGKKHPESRRGSKD